MTILSDFIDTYHYLYPGMPLTVPIFIISCILYILLPKLYKFCKNIYRYHRRYLQALGYFIESKLGVSAYKPIMSHKLKARPYRAASRHSQPLLPADQNFTPWRIDFAKASLFWLLGLGWLIGCLYQYRHIGQLYIAALSLLSVAPFYRGFSYLDYGQNRIHGKKVEILWRGRFIDRMPEDWQFLSKRLIPNGGDIDIPVQLPGGEICVIDIKCWQHWRGYARIHKALRDIRYQKHTIRATYGFIWLPCDAISNVLHYKDIVVVSGNASFLVKEIQQRLRYVATIKFLERPSDAILTFVKSRRFHWNKVAKQWEGTCSPGEVDKLRHEIAPEKGILDLRTSSGSGLH